MRSKTGRAVRTAVVAATVATACNSGSLFSQKLVLVGPAPTDVALGSELADTWSAPVLPVSGALTDDQKTYPAHSSASIEDVYIIDSGNTINATLETQIGDLISGALGHTSATNPTVPAVSQ